MNTHLYLSMLLYMAAASHLPAQEQPPDSLVLFRAAMEREAIKEFDPRDPEGYLLVWKEQREGNQFIYNRGDGSTLRDLLTSEGLLRPEITDQWGPSGITNYGNRYAVVWVDPQTGVARHTVWYFERPISTYHDKK
ncbi:MAG: hypothetical protein IPJ85_12570 [Flavobacteriales bacterium]|nr:hypothetical protein [Flavobacteriales bacterium]